MLSHPFVIYLISIIDTGFINVSIHTINHVCHTYCSQYSFFLKQKYLYSYVHGDVMQVATSVVLQGLDITLHNV